MTERSAPRIMGILNLTPDSFSDGNAWLEPARAVEHTLAMVEAGADIIDIGAESTRPGSTRVSAAEQICRLQDVLQALQTTLPPDVAVSIDTTRSRVAEMAIDHGVTLVNDISAGRDDPEMLSLCAERKVSVALMHMQGEPATMNDNPVYVKVVSEVREFLLQRAAAAEFAGIDRDRIFIDPGIGFGKRSEHNLALLAGLKELVNTGYPVLLGASRKRFMGQLFGRIAPGELLPSTIATTVLGVQAGATIFRVHDIAANRQAADVTKNIVTSQ
jgi:dihydropteroate synthase